MFMSKSYEVLMNCFMFAAFFVEFPILVISLVVAYCTDEAKKAETRIQLIKSYYVTVVFLAQ